MNHPKNRLFTLVSSFPRKRAGTYRPIPGFQIGTITRYARNEVHGFTLVELLVVLVILGLLAGLVGPRVLKYVGESKTKTARLQIEELSATIDLYHLDVGAYPTTKEGLQALIRQPAGVEQWNGPYLKKQYVPKDPWRRDYYYKSPGDHGHYDLYSLGADGKEGGSGDSADVANWQ